MQHYDFKDKTVLVTGASLGIGAAFARELSGRGARLVLVARSEAKLRTLASELGRADVIVQDLARPGAAQAVFDAVTAAGLTVDVLINNAGFGTYGPFAETSLATQREELALNIGALVELTHTFLPTIERQRGGVIHVASTAGIQPVPFMAVYAASKAFVLSFSESLWGEYRARGVRVLALCPGATDTPFFERTGEAAAVGKKARPEAVVQFALRAFDRGRSHAIHGSKNYWLAQSSRLVPRETVVKIASNMMQPRVSSHVALPRA
ncbi:MAG: 3-oxoacyl-[acyl-carrier protein] reductase [Myxococcaceae bacterium]|nr:3-oxoacyl-[acyl-carrier protein] reductase [Myxococcaceae bacterium]